MKTAIWKFQLEITDRQTIIMPALAQILTAQMQGKKLCLWALVNTDAPKRAREIEIIGTGNSVPGANRHYISTVQMLSGSLVWHIFEIK